MKKNKIINSIADFFKSVYTQLFKINGTAQRVALGFGLGVFLGIFPGTGPIAALFCAVVFRINRASALLGCLLTNTWISVVTFLLSIKVGSVIMRVSWIDVSQQWQAFLDNFRWLDLFKLSVLKIILPVIAGYIVVGLFFGLVSYLTALAVLKKTKYAHKN